MPTVLYTDSFDHYSAGDLGKKWTTVGGAGAANLAGIGRNSTQGLRSTTAGSGGSVTQSIGNQATVYVEIALRYTGTPTDVGFLILQDSGTVQCDLRMTATGELRVTRAGTSLAVTSGLGLLVSTYYHIGFMATIHDTAGVYEVRVNGVQKLIGSSADTKNTSNAYANQVRVNSPAESNADFDDLIISSDGFCGDCRVQALYPQANGNYTAWTPSTGSGWQCVDEALMNSDTDYVSSATTGQRNSYDFQSIGTGTIKAVQHVTTHRKDDVGSRTIKQFARVSGTDYDDSAVSVADTYLMQRRVMSVNPATGTAWSSAALDAAEFGTQLFS